VQLQAINQAQLALLEPQQTIVHLCQWQDLEAEADEMWSYVQRKEKQRCLWHAIDHATGKILAYVLADHKDQAFLQLKSLLEPFGISQYYTDDWGAYQRHLSTALHTVGKRQTQKIERKHLTLRTRIKRLARKTICFSKTILMHDTVIGLFINRYEFGLTI
jgi:insertion element IS1 protein InsB